MMNKLAIEILKNVKNDCDNKLSSDGLSKERQVVLAKVSDNMIDIIAEFVEQCEK